MAKTTHGRIGEDAVLSAIARGYLSVDDLGQIWWIADRRGGQGKRRTSSTPCDPRRAEGMVTGGYMDVNVQLDGRRYAARAHRIAYRYLVGPIDPGKTINHINGRKTDNRPLNLEQATMSEQAIHARYVLGSRVLQCFGERHHHAKLTESQVADIRDRRANGETLTAIAADFGIAFQTVSKITNRKSWIGPQAAMRRGAA